MIDRGGYSVTLQTGFAKVWSMALSPDGRLALTGTNETSSQLWDLASGLMIRAFPSGAARAVAFSPDGRTALVEDQIFDIATGRRLQRLEGHDDVIWCVAFSPDGRFILTGSEDQTVGLWDLREAGRGQILSIAATGFDAVAFSPDGRRAILGGDGGTCTLVEVPSGQTVTTFAGHAGRVRMVAFSPDGGQLLTAASDGTVRLWNVASARELTQLAGTEDVVVHVSFQPSGPMALTETKDHHIRLWNIEAGQMIQAFVGHTDRLTTAALSGDGTLIVSADHNGTLRLWDVTTGRQWSCRTGARSIRTAALAPDGTRALTRASRQVALWTLETGRRDILGTDDTRGDIESVDLAFSSDGRLALAAGKTSQVWDVASARLVVSLDHRDHDIRAACFSADATRLVICSGRGVAWVRNVPSGTLLHELAAPEDDVCGVAFSPDGRTVGMGSIGGFVRVWDVATGAILTTFEVEFNIHAFGFTPDGSRVVVGSAFAFPELWDIATGRRVAAPLADLGLPQSGHRTVSLDARLVVLENSGGRKELRCGVTGAMLATLTDPWPTDHAALSLDGRSAITVGADGVARVWSLPEGALRRALFVNAAGDWLALGKDEWPIAVGGQEDEAYALVRGLDIRRPSDLRRRGYDLPTPTPMP